MAKLQRTRASAVAVACLLLSACQSDAHRVVFADVAAKTSHGQQGGAKTVVLLGTTGAGKSTLANFLTAQVQEFEVFDRLESGTTEVKFKELPFFGDAELGTVRIVDTPGLLDTKGSTANKEQWDATCEVLKEQVQTAHALVLVMNKEMRMTPEFREALKQIRDSYGKDLWSFLRVVITRAEWDTEEQSTKAVSYRKVLLEVEESIVGDGLVEDSTRQLIEKLPVYGVQMPMDLMVDTEEYLDEHDCDDLEGKTFADILKLGISWEDKLKESGFASLLAWKKAVGKKELPKAVDDDDVLSYATCFRKNNLGRLNALRLEVVGREDVLQLDPAKLSGGAGGGLGRTVLLSPVAVDGSSLGRPSASGISADSTMKQVMEQDVEPMGVIQALRGLSWIKGIALSIAGIEVRTDKQLQLQLQQMIQAAGGAGQQAEVHAKVSFFSGSPPAVLDPALFEICVEQDDFEAAQALVDDRLTEPSRLAVMASLDDQGTDHLFPQTRTHGKVWSKIKELQKDEAAKLSKRADYKEVFEKQKQDRENLLSGIAQTRQQLAPLFADVDQMASDQSDRAEESRSAVASRAKDLFNEIRSTKLITLPRRDPNSSELKTFLQGVERSLNKVQETIEGEIYGVKDLLLQSQVLKGIRLRPQPEVMTSDVLELVSLPKMTELFPLPGEGGSRESMYYSESSLNRAKTIREKGFDSSSLSAEGTGGMITPSGVGAVKIASRLAYASEREAEGRRGEISEKTSYVFRQDHKQPQRRLKLDTKYLRLSPRLLSQIAAILMTDQAVWKDDIISLLFSVYGSHYCPSLELGGIWTHEARFTSSSTTKESDFKRAASKCLQADLDNAMTVFTIDGGGKAGSSAAHRSCDADASEEAENFQEVVRSTEISRSCFPNIANCPSAPEDYEKALKFNGNWGVLDRMATSCVGIWNFLRQEQNEHDLVATLRRKGGTKDESEAKGLIFEFREVAEKVWHVHELDMPNLCRGWNWRSSLGGAPSDCELATQEGKSLMDLPLEKLRELWGDLNYAQDKEALCDALDSCNYPHQGTCKVDLDEDASNKVKCVCNTTFTGTKCEEKQCHKEKRGDCISLLSFHPSADAKSLVSCDTLGADYDGAIPRWESCTKSAFSVTNIMKFVGKFGPAAPLTDLPDMRLVCEKSWTCPAKDGKDCCKR